MQTQTSVEELECMQVALEFAALLVHEEPGVALMESLDKAGCFDEAPFGQGNPNVTRGLAQMKGWLKGARGEGLEGAVAALQREWLDLLVGLGTPKAPCWESYYTEADHRLFARNSIELQALHRKYGAELKTRGTEPCDHLGILLKFAALLVAREAYLTGENDPGVQEVRDDCAQMFERHVLPWLPEWYANMARNAQSAYYKGLADLVFGLIQSFVTRFGMGYYPAENRFRAIR